MQKIETEIKRFFIYYLNSRIYSLYLRYRENFIHKNVYEILKLIIILNFFK
jgi:hypothetical protein